MQDWQKKISSRYDISSDTDHISLVDPSICNHYGKSVSLGVVLFLL